MVWHFSSEHLPAALQRRSLFGYIPLHSPVSGQCHSECHMGSTCVCCGCSLDSFLLLKMIVLMHNELVSVIIITCSWILLDTWMLGVVSKQPRQLHDRVGYSTTGKFLDPSDEWAGRGCYCFLMLCHSWAFLTDQEWAPKTCRAQIWIFQF